MTEPTHHPAPPPLDEPEPSPLLRWTVLSVLVVAGGLFGTLTLPAPDPPPHVLSTHSVPVVSQTPATQQHFAEAWAHYLGARFADADQALTRVMDDAPADPLVGFLRVQTLTALDDHEGAGAAADAMFALPTDPDTPFAALTEPLSGVLDGQWGSDPVEPDYRAYLRRHPDDYLAHLVPLEPGRGVSETDQQWFYARAQRIDPEPPVVHHRYATSLLSQGRFSEAAQTARRGLVTAPDSATLRHLQGRAQLLGGDFEAAVQSLNLAGRAMPDSQAVQTNRAIAHQMSGQTPPKDPVPTASPRPEALAETLVGLGQLTQARALFPQQQPPARDRPQANARCERPLVHAITQVEAQAEGALVALLEALEGPCARVGIDRWWLASGRVAAAGVLVADQPDLARTHLDAFDALMPAPDPDLPLAQRARSLRDQLDGAR